MASMFCAISFIKNASNANKYIAGTAVYRAGDDEFIEYKFKAIHSEFTPLVEEIWQNTIALIIRRFAFEKDELNVTINQYVPLNISTLGDNPTLYDLPISPTLGIFTGPIQDPAITENGQALEIRRPQTYCRKIQLTLSLYPPSHKKPPQPSQHDPNLNSIPPNIISEQMRVNQLRSSLNNIR
ncbi:23068_t:CDS:2, partial [Gigaspora rosea]